MVEIRAKDPGLGVGSGRWDRPPTCGHGSGRVRVMSSGKSVSRQRRIARSGSSVWGSPEKTLAFYAVTQHDKQGWAWDASQPDPFDSNPEEATCFFGFSTILSSFGFDLYKKRIDQRDGGYFGMAEGKSEGCSFWR
ncbi:hypothetical protein Nepgr_027492 [Nepenthes gracilis]|uniref:Uncharacterized protein n=1 Tax=Nepenthes gracilis TaxID=150966 RepID=A0AAD3Y359_NEPGR|nr:hypothetical protein Nepgr_027492 [Nepenthes gracilis]